MEMGVARDWILLIYSLPSQPSRKRAYVWRELKKLGAVYLRDGVALLPRIPEVEPRMEAILERIREYAGTGDLILSPVFPQERELELVERFQQERLDEYRELYRAGVRFLRDVLSEVDADDFGFPDVDNLESELARLHRWLDQIRARDYFGVPELERVKGLLEKCERAFEQFMSTAHSRADGPARPPVDDVFEQLGGGRGAADISDDLPL